MLEENNYYPGGLKHADYNQTKNKLSRKITNDQKTATPTIDNPYDYKFNGVEYQEEFDLNMYSMDFRQYDPAIARFTSIDPVTHFSKSTYNAFDNNPVFWADPSGADAESCNNCDEKGRPYVVNGVYQTRDKRNAAAKGNGGNNEFGALNQIQSSSNTTEFTNSNQNSKTKKLRYVLELIDAHLVLKAYSKALNKVILKYNLPYEYYDPRAHIAAEYQEKSDILSDKATMTFDENYQVTSISTDFDSYSNNNDYNFDFIGGVFLINDIKVLNGNPSEGTHTNYFAIGIYGENKFRSNKQFARILFKTKQLRSNFIKYYDDLSKQFVKNIISNKKLKK